MSRKKKSSCARPLKPGLRKTELPTKRPRNILSLNVVRPAIATSMIWGLSLRRVNQNLLRDSGTLSKAGNVTTVLSSPPPLNQKFSSVFTNEDTVPDMGPSPHPDMADININEPCKSMQDTEGS